MPHNIELLFFNPANSSRHQEHNRNHLINKKKTSRHKKMGLKNSHHFGDTSEEPSKILNIQNKPKNICSSQDIKKHLKIIKIKTSSSIITQKTKAYNSKYVINHVNEYRVPGNLNPFGRVRQPIKWRVYRCQFGAQEESCCCSCNSDAMFEVMKSLYDCYKKKNCDHCNCILCGHLPREERKAGEERKSAAAIGAETTSMKERGDEMRKIAASLQGQSPAEKEKILRQMAMDGIPLPKGATPSEKKLIKKVRNDLGLPPEPTSPDERAKLRRSELAGMVVPLEGKLPAEKEKILRKQAALGLPFPVGRTPSEKALIDKIRSGMPSKVVGVSSEKLRKAKAAGFLTPLEGKTPEQKEKILKGLAKMGVPLPEGKTPSTKKLIDKIRKELGLPPEPKNQEMRNMYNKALADGLITPLEGKTPEQKEKILRGLAQASLPLPEGRTPSEKALIKKVKADTRYKTPAAVPSKFPVGIPSEKLRKAKAAGFLTPLAGKTPEQKEKILRGLAQHGIPLPEGETPSDKKIIDKVRKELGLPPEPKSQAMRDKYNKAQADGIITPLEEKTPAQKEKILKGMAEAGLPLPEGRTTSEKELIKKVKAETGYKTPAAIPSGFPAGIPSEKLRKAKAEGLITPLTGKTPEQKEKILKGIAKMGIPLPEAKTSSEKKIIDKIRKDLGLPPEPKSPSMRDKYNKAQAQGILTPLEGKTPAKKEKILRGMVQAGIPLPEGRTPSEKALINKVKAETGYKTPTGERPPRLPPGIPSEKLRKARAEGLITPLTGKTPEQKDKILKGLAKLGIPLPEGKTMSEKKLIDKVRKELGLPPEPKSQAMRDMYNKAQADGIITPLEGKTPAQKEKILKGMAQAGLPLPEGRTPSEKALINKVKAETGYKTPAGVGPFDISAGIPSEKLRKAKAAGFLTPLAGKTPEQKEKILRGLAQHGIPLPDGKTPSEKKLIDKVRKELGLPPEPKSRAMRDKYNKALADGIMTPLEGKTPAQKEKILKSMAEAGLPLPEGRTPSEKALIKKVKAETGYKTPAAILSGFPAGIPSEKLRKAKAEGLMTPLTGKTPEQKEKIIKGIAKLGIPLPEGKTPSERKLIDKVRKELGLPPEPKSRAMRDKYNKALADGIMTPLEGKTPAQKEKILKGMAQAGLPLPEGRTPSEKALISKVKAETGYKTPLMVPSGFPAGITSEKLRKAKAAGFLTPLTGKTPAQKEKILRGLAAQGIPMPEPRTSSEKALIDRIKADVKARPSVMTSKKRPLSDEARKLDEETAKVMKEGKGPSDECICGILTPESEKLSARLGLRKSEQAGVPTGIASEKLRKAKAAGLLTPLAGKTPEQREKILRGLAQHGIPLPEGKTPSEKKLINKIRNELGLPPEPKSQAMRDKYNKAQAQGLITPLQGKTPAQKEKILKGMVHAGVPLPEGRTPSEKALINKIKAEPGYKTPGERPPGFPAGITSEKLRKAKAAGFLTPLAGKPPEQKEKILRGLAQHGIPLLEGKTPSEKKIIDKVRKELGLPPEPKSQEMRDKYNKALADGIITPLEGKTPAQKEKILKGMAQAGLPLPEGRTPSEKALIKKVKAETGYKTPGAVPSRFPTGIPSEKLRKAKAEGLITPLTGKTPEQKEKILKGLAKLGIPLPEGKTESEKKMIDKVRKELGLPPEPKPQAMKDKYNKALADGIITPLEGKTTAQKEKILKGLAQAGLPLPEGRTPSEKALIKKVKAETGYKTPEELRKPSEKLRKAKAAGLLTTLEGKTPQQKEKILRGLAMQGLPFPLAKTESDKKLAAKVRADLGMPPEPKNAAEKEKYDKAMADGVVLPLEGKTPEEKERVLRDLQDRGIELPIGRTPSEKALIAKIRAGGPPRIPSEKLRKAKAAGLLTPLEGKTAAQKEKILKGLAELGLPLPEGKTPSEKSLIQKLKAEYGIPPEAITPSEKAIIAKARADGLLTPLAGKTPEKKEKILKGLAEAGLPLPEGRTPSEKALIKKVRAAADLPPERTTSERAGKIKKKDKGIGAGRSAAKAALAAAGIDQKYEDIKKTTKCDRACGCDKKKIRFKHSYVKIRVTSPDISSLCPCPEECIPGVKGGVFVDNEGIKVTVGSAMGVPLLTFKSIDDYSEKEVKLESVKNGLSEHSDLTAKNNSQTSSNSTYGEQNYTDDGDTYASELEIDSSTDYNGLLLKNYLQDKSYDYIMHHFNSHYEILKNYSISSHILKNVQNAIPPSFTTLSFEETLTKVNSKTIYNSIVMLKTESSLGFSSSLTASIKTISIISLHNSSIIPTSSHYICYPESMSASSLDEDNSKYYNNEADYIATDVRTSESDEITNIKYTYASNKSHKPKRDRPSKIYNKNIFTYGVSQQNIDNDGNCYKPYGNKYKPIIIINELDRSSCDVMQIVEEVMSQKNLSKTSSIFVVVPTSDEDDDDISDSASSTICICLSNNFFNSNKKLDEKTVQYHTPKPTGRGIKFTAKGKVNLNSALSAAAIPSYSKDDSFNNLKVTETFATEHRLTVNSSKHNKKCQVNEEIVTKGKYNSFSMDTSQDRPCCCGQPRPVEPNISNHPRSTVLSDFITPMIASQGLPQEVYQTRPDLNLKCQTPYLFPNNCTSYSTCNVYPCKKNTETDNICGDIETQNPRNEQRKEKVPMKFEIKGRLAKQTETAGECPPCECVKAANTDGGCKPSDCKYSDCNGNEADNNKKVGVTPIIHVGPSNASCSRYTNKKLKKVTMEVDCSCDSDDEVPNPGNKTLRSSPPAPHPTLASATRPPTFKSVGCQCCMCDISSEEGLETQTGNTGYTGKEVDAQLARQSMEEQSTVQTQGRQTATLEQSTANSKKSTCQCDTIHKLRNRLWRKSKNIECECRPPKNYKDCECPSAEEDETVKEKVEEEEIDYSQYAGPPYISEKEYLRRVRQEKTELTERTSSGFRIVFQKRSIGSSEMSFEDALKYFEEHPEDTPPPIKRNEIESNEAEDCKCGPFVTYPEDTEETARSGKGPTGDTGVVCECPPFEGEKEGTEGEDVGGGAGGGKYFNKDKSGDEILKGLNLRIGGKGTGSKGLAGICCFDMLQESTHLISHSLSTASH